MLDGVDKPGFWIRKSRGDLFVARLRVRGMPVEIGCFHAQQSAEKALKAVFVAHGFPFELTHNLGALVEGLTARGVEIPDEIRGDAELLRRVTRHAVISRYSGGMPPNAADRKEAAQFASIALDWAKTEIARARKGKKASGRGRAD